MTTKTKTTVRSCVRCGCTEAKACAGGCAWMPAPLVDVCTACATTMEELEVGLERAVQREKADLKASVQASDPVDHPRHYTKGGIECIDAIEAAIGPDGAAGFCRGNAIKYLWRAGAKVDLVEDLRKAVWYINREISIRQRMGMDSAIAARKAGA